MPARLDPFPSPPPDRGGAPWPVRSPIHPTEMPAAVRSIPLGERLDFEWRMSRRYFGQLFFYWPKALLKAFRLQYPKPVSDARFAELLWDTSMSRLLTPVLDTSDRTRFGALLEPGGRYAKLDCTAFEGMPALRGMYVAPTVSLFRNDRGVHPTLVAIAVGDVVLTPEESDAWMRAKHFALMGAGVHMVACHHIPLHFPLDTVNAVTKALLPRTHVVRQLLEPHFRSSLALNDSALHSRMSVLTNEPYFTYTPFPMAGPHVFRLTRAGFGGIPGSSGYPAWSFNDGPDAVLGDYGVFLRAYYDAMYPLGEAVAAAVAEDDPDVRRWGDAIGGFLYGFPTGQELTDRTLLSRVLTRIIWSASVGHAADHHDFGKIPIEEIPFRLRVPPPRSRDDRLPEGARAGRRRDAFRHEMARAMFFQAVTIVPLPSVRYVFTAPELREAAAAFIARLHETDRTLPVRRFVPLDRIPASVPF